MAWRAVCGLICISLSSIGFGNRLQSSWSGGGGRHQANCETQTQLPSPQGWRGAVPCQGMQPALLRGALCRGSDLLQATEYMAKVGQNHHGAGQGMGFALGTHPAATASVFVLKPGLNPGSHSQPLSGFGGLGWGWRVLAVGQVTVVVSTWTFSFRRGWSWARHHPAPGNGRGTWARGRASICPMAWVPSSTPARHGVCLEPSFAPQHRGSVGQGKAGPPPPPPDPCQALPLLCPRGWHGEGLWGGCAGRGAAAWGPP